MCLNGIHFDKLFYIRCVCFILSMFILFDNFYSNDESDLTFHDDNGK